MVIIANVVVGLVAVLHLYFLVLEMFLWTTPFGRRTVGLTADFAAASKSLAANQGLYNGFLAAGLVWGPRARCGRCADQDLLPRLRRRGRRVRRLHREPQDPLGSGPARSRGPRARPAVLKALSQAPGWLRPARATTRRRPRCAR